MNDFQKIVISTTTETPTTSVVRSTYEYRYAYARSLDSRNEGDNGQDYLVIIENEKRLAFALCDGVSQSFYGDIAARLLGEAVTEYLFPLGLSLSLEELTLEIANLLQSLVTPASRKIQEYEIPDNLPAMLQKALDQKRTLGSESTLVAGVADFASGEIVLAWLGDSNLRIWGPAGELTSNLGSTFLTDERWSSRKGPVGDVHVFINSTNTIRRITAYSDGLNRINERLRFEVPGNDAIDEEINEAGDDDISYFELIIKNQLQTVEKKIDIPADLSVRQTDVGIELTWEAVAKATSYEVRLFSQQGNPTYYQTKTTSLNLTSSDLPADLKTVRVRAWKDAVAGNWSDPTAYSSPSKNLQDDTRTPEPTPPPGPGGGSGKLPPHPPIPRDKKAVLTIVLGCLLLAVLFLVGFFLWSVVINPPVTPTVTHTNTLAITDTPSLTVTPTFTLTPTLTSTATTIPTDTPTLAPSNTPSPTLSTPTAPLPTDQLP